MMALIHLHRRRSLVAGLLVASLAFLPIGAFAKTRITVTLGDPDIGDNGQKPGPVTSAALVTSAPQPMPDLDHPKLDAYRSALLWLLLRYGSFYR
jgi:hypothetical protein